MKACGWIRLRCPIALAFLVAVSVARAAIPASERAALIDLYNSTNGPRWYLYVWDGPPGTECSWAGITCDSAGAHVIGLNLGAQDGGIGRGLSGPVPASIRDLTFLEHLDLSINDVTGPMPTLGGWTSLRSVDFSSNDFVGSIPPLANLPNLESADFSSNYQVRGSLPSFDGAPNLVTFRAAGLGLTGPIPSLAALTHLSTFDVAGNFLEGSIPPVSGFHELTYFGVGGNELTGPLPAIAGLTHLRFFDAAKNHITGTIPPLTNLPALTTYIMHDDELTGAIPSLSGALVLATFNVSNNNLSGAVPALANAAQLVDFEAENNHLTGSLPSLPSSLTKLKVGGNDLTGHLPAIANLAPGGSSVCPNQLDPVPDTTWDVVVDVVPWYANCNDSYVNFDQFGLTGSWYDPQAGGQGVLLASMPDLRGDGLGFVFGGWFTFPPFGSTSGATYTWFSFEGNVDTSTRSATLGLYETLGGNFAAPPPPTTNAIGTVTIALKDCRRGTLSYHFDDGRTSDGSMNFWRLTDNTTCTITGADQPAGSSSLLSGAWYDPSMSGQGILVDIVPSQNLLFAAWFTFAPDAASGDPAVGQRWYSLQGAYSASKARSISDVTIYQQPSGAFGVESDYPAVPVGGAQLTFESCDSLTLEYGFYDYPPRSGTLHLIRIGSAPPGCE